jgi:hypothetical protein
MCHRLVGQDGGSVYDLYGNFKALSHECDLLGNPLAVNPVEGLMAIAGVGVSSRYFTQFRKYMKGSDGGTGVEMFAEFNYDQKAAIRKDMAQARLSDDAIRTQSISDIVYHARTMVVVEQESKRLETAAVTAGYVVIADWMNPILSTFFETLVVGGTFGVVQSAAALVPYAIIAMMVTTWATTWIDKKRLASRLPGNVDAGLAFLALGINPNLATILDDALEGILLGRIQSQLQAGNTNSLRFMRSLWEIKGVEEEAKALSKAVLMHVTHHDFVLLPKGEATKGTRAAYGGMTVTWARRDPVTETRFGLSVQAVESYAKDTHRIQVGAEIDTINASDVTQMSFDNALHKLTTLGETADFGFVKNDIFEIDALRTEAIALELLNVETKLNMLEPSLQQDYALEQLQLVTGDNKFNPSRFDIYVGQYETENIATINQSKLAVSERHKATWLARFREWIDEELILLLWEHEYELVPVKSRQALLDEYSAHVAEIIKHQRN